MTDCDKRFRISLVEDNDDHAELALFHLRQVAPDAAVERFEDGLAFVSDLFARIKEDKPILPHLVLLDLKLPRLDGIGVLERVRSEAALRSVPIVMMTTSDADHDKSNAYQNHVNSYVTKPASFAEFRALMGSLVSFWRDYNRLPRRQGKVSDRGHGGTGEARQQYPTDEASR